MTVEVREMLASPTSTGSTGVHFEAKVAAQYLLSLLSSIRGRGLPGATVTEVRVQQAPEGTPLDDIVIVGTTSTGETAQLDIQVKHKASFSQSDRVFKDVCGQIAETIQQPDFFNNKHMMGIAIARSSAKIDSAYQDVLTWARELSSAESFFKRLEMEFVANNDMRAFVSTFRRHLAANGVTDTEDAIWKALRRMLILPFDYSAPESAALALALERSARCLAEDCVDQNEALWNALVDRALEMAKAGGAMDREALVDYLRAKSFRLAGMRHNSAAMTVLDEDARLALNDIGDTIGEVNLARRDHLEAVHDAFATTRYVEIQGDPGVGKSGLLKHLGLQQIEQGRAIVLAPGRIKPRGWLNMRAVLGFEGQCRDLLGELVLEGEALLLIDNLDRFSEDDLTTVRDIIREAATVPGLKVLATSRRPLDPDVPRWLHEHDLKPFRPGAPLQIGELSGNEVQELRTATPNLARLLAADHPARNVARNLFRLSRLAMSSGDAVPKTELDMMKQWWHTGDGGMEDEMRERRRLFRAMARHALVSGAPYDASGHPPRMIDGLISRRTLLERNDDQVDFYHDVLREWAIASLLIEASDTAAILDLKEMATPSYSRAIELVAAKALADDPTGAAWSAMLSELNATENHPSWGRAALLGIVRSDQFDNLLERARPLLLENGAERLRSLIRVIRAVDVVLGEDVLLKLGVSDLFVPETFNIPAGPSWARLIKWLNANMASIPAVAYPEIADLFFHWSMGFGGRDPWTGILGKWQYFWLEQIEKVREADRFTDRYEPFGEALSENELEGFESTVRTAFLGFATNTPDEVKAYLKAQLSRKSNDQTMQAILKLSNSVAPVAPQELAELTCVYLFADPPGPEASRHSAGLDHDMFRYVDSQYLPVSPAHGPFFPLLQHHPEIGLTLIRKFVNHAIDWTGGSDETPAFTINWRGKPHNFTRLDSYGWLGSGNIGYAFGSAVMALETWGHNRLEAGDPPEAVITDVIGPSGSPAAFAAVAVHLIISHMDLCEQQAVSFLASPELLVVDLERLARQQVESIDIFDGIDGANEPAGGPTRANLLSRPSRRNSLESMLKWLAIYGQPETHMRLTDALSAARDRLPAIQPTDTLLAPALFASYAINLIDPQNWAREKVALSSDSSQFRYHYLPPAEEQAHFDRVRAIHAPQLAKTDMQIAILLTAERQKRSSPTFARKAVDWVKQSEQIKKDEDETNAWMADDTLVNAALIAMRDGDADLVDAERGWARSVFNAVLFPEEERRSQLSFRLTMTAFTGLIYSLDEMPVHEEYDLLLRAVYASDVAQTEDLAAPLSVLYAKSPDALKSVLRCAITSQIYVRKHWDVSEEEFAALKTKREQALSALREAELIWLSGQGNETDWPVLPEPMVQIRRGIRIGPRTGGDKELEPLKPHLLRFNANKGAIWLNAVRAVLPNEKGGWLTQVASTYAHWTFAANGLGGESNQEIDNVPYTWSIAIASLAADACDPETGLSAVDGFDSRLVELPDKHFMSMMVPYLIELIDRYFHMREIPAPAMINVRKRLTERLVQTREFRSHVSRRDTSISHNLAPAFGNLFFASQFWNKPPKCYLSEAEMDQANPFLTGMKLFVAESPSYFAAFSILSFVEVSPRAEHLDLLLSAAEVWLAHFQDDTGFWIDQQIGHRVIRYLENFYAVQASDPRVQEFRKRTVYIVGHLVSIGLPEAARLESML